MDNRPLNKVMRAATPFPELMICYQADHGSCHLICTTNIGRSPLPLNQEQKLHSVPGRDIGSFRYAVLDCVMYQGLMDNVLASVPCQECLTYLDDVLVHRKSFLPWNIHNTFQEKMYAIRDWPVHGSQRLLKSLLELASSDQRFVLR